MTGAPGRRLTLAALVVGLALAGPVLVVTLRIGAGTGGLWSHLASTVLPAYVGNTVVLALGVGAVAGVLGVATAGLVTFCTFPGRGFLRWALLLPLAVPPYLGAYAWTDLLQAGGPVQRGLHAVLAVPSGELPFPEVRSLPGAILVLGLALYPYVYLTARAAFLERAVGALEVARTLGRGPWGSFLRVGLPLARPAIVAGLALVAMETVAEFGAVDYFAVDTLATGVYRTFTLPDPHSLTAAAQLSSCLLVGVAALVVLEAWARRRGRFHDSVLRPRGAEPVPLAGARSGAAFLACAIPILLGFVVPATIFLVKTVAVAGATSRDSFGVAGRQSFLLGVAAAGLSVLLALPLAYVRRGKVPVPVRLLTRLAGLGYAIPGTVVAIGVLVPLVRLDRWLLEVAGGRLVGLGPGLLLSGSIFALLYGYQVRFLALSLHTVEAGLARIGPGLDAAARTLGASPGRVLRDVHLPLLRGSVAVAAILVFVEVVKELPATLILRPFDVDTLAVRVYRLASDERLAEASPAALALVVVGTIPVALLAWWLERGSPETATVDGEDETT